MAVFSRDHKVIARQFMALGLAFLAVGGFQLLVGQAILHPLHPAGLLGEQHLALTGHRAHHADLAVGPPRRAQEPQAHQLLQPLTVLHVALAPRHVLHLAGVNQPNLQPALLKNFKYWNPIDPGRTHNILPKNIRQPSLLFSIRFILFVVSG